MFYLYMNAAFNAVSVSTFFLSSLVWAFSFKRVMVRVDIIQLLCISCKIVNNVM